MTSNTTCVLGNDKDWECLVNDDRVLLRSRSKNTTNPKDDVNKQPRQYHGGWYVISHAVLNGGIREIFQTENGDGSITGLQVLNYKVPADYDGINPNPQALLRQFATKEDDNNTSSCKNPSDSRFTVGLLTAASMLSLRTASRSATVKDPTSSSSEQTCIVDAIVTAGISNARASGADADVFQLATPASSSDDGDGSKEKEKAKFGTINTIVVLNVPLDKEAALLEAYTIAVEAKCRAMSDSGIVCAKNPSDGATGTGTDSTVLVCQNDSHPNHSTAIRYAGKHTLLGELVGQAVYDATMEAVQSNLNVMYQGYPFPSLCYRLNSYKLQLWQAIYEGHRPFVPSRPMVPVPKPKGLKLLVGLLGMFISFGLHLLFQHPKDDSFCQTALIDSLNEADENTTFVNLVSNSIYKHAMQPSWTVLLGVFFVDRYLGSLMMPLAIHPVVLVGKLITKLSDIIPKPFFERAIPGFLSGCLLWATTVTISLISASILLLLPTVVMPFFLQFTQKDDDHPETCRSNSLGLHLFLLRQLQTFFVWFLQVFVVRGSLSLQLLGSIALQMAHFLERGQLDQARAQLSWLCSRDPSQLQPDELAGATLESVAENLSDSVTSPLVYYVLFGPLGAFAFRVINTMDSRLGFRDHREWVGKFPARVDDVVNLFPARLTAIVLAIAAEGLLVVVGGSRNNNNNNNNNKGTIILQEGLSIAWRDASQCDSPNAGWPMATMAGILGVRLEKRGQYSLNGPPNGGTGKAPGVWDIRRGQAIFDVAGLLLFTLAMVVSK